MTGMGRTKIMVLHTMRLSHVDIQWMTKLFKTLDHKS